MFKIQLFLHGELNTYMQCMAEYMWELSIKVLVEIKILGGKIS